MPTLKTREFDNLVNHCTYNGVSPDLALQAFLKSREPSENPDPVVVLDTLSREYKLRAQIPKNTP